MSEEPAGTVRIDVAAVGWWAVILSWPSGARYANQVHGHLTRLRDLEGVLIPLPNEDLDNLGRVYPGDAELYAHFGPKGRYGGWCAPDYSHGLHVESADWLDRHLPPWVRVDRARLADSGEAWVWVTVTDDMDFPDDPNLCVIRGLGPAGRPGVLTWENSD